VRANQEGHRGAGVGGFPAKPAGPNQIPWRSYLYGAASSPVAGVRVLLNLLRLTISSSVVGQRVGHCTARRLAARRAGLRFRLRLPTLRPKAPCVLEHWNWMRQQPRPQWHERASRAEIDEAIDKLIGDLRMRRETIMNRVNMRTRVWVAHHSERRAPRRKSAA